MVDFSVSTRGGRTTTTIPSPSHILPIFSSEPPRNTFKNIFLCVQSFKMRIFFENLAIIRAKNIVRLKFCNDFLMLKSYNPWVWYQTLFRLKLKPLLPPKWVTFIIQKLCQCSCSRTKMISKEKVMFNLKYLNHLSFATIWIQAVFKSLRKLAKIKCKIEIIVSIKFYNNLRHSTRKRATKDRCLFVEHGF